MRKCTWRSMLFTIVGTLLLMTFCCARYAIASPDDDSTDRDLRILFTGHLNFDRHADTVLGRADAHFNYLPRRIRWGADPGDSLIDDAAPGNQPMRQTTITYPGWGNFSGSVAFQRLNPDTLTDIILYIWGTIGQGRERRDTMRALALFGQEGLDSVPVVHVADVGTFQDAPFFAMELRVGTELARPGSRDISGRRSYELMPVGLDVGKADTNDRPIPLAGVAERVAVRLYPNPAGTSAQMEGEDLQEGFYRVEVVAVNGQVYHREDVKVEGSKRLVETFDVRRLPSGYYVVRLERDGRPVGSYPIIITR